MCSKIIEKENRYFDDNKDHENDDNIASHHTWINFYLSRKVNAILLGIELYWHDDGDNVAMIHWSI